MGSVAPDHWPTGVGRVLGPDGAGPLFASFRLSPSGTDALVERCRRRWLVTHRDTELDAPTAHAFAAAADRGGAA
ncbi:hypothetical protein [Amycolatopsis methanolica]|uniref:hypothetical protein n=1 Tax=Amycolatopsis methanolica TaxID=1814 RepID=UPI0034482368